MVPGDAFGQCGEGYIRCSYAASVEQITEALGRMEKFMARHAKKQKTKKQKTKKQKTMYAVR